MQKYLYLGVDIAAIIVPLLFSFQQKNNFSLKWKFLWPAILITATVFLIWDEWFISMGVWGFNSQYLIGVQFLHLPIEETLFFICIPYACLFTYEAVGYKLKNEAVSGKGRVFSGVLIVILLIAGLKYTDRWYPAVTFLSLAIYLFLLLLAKPGYLGKFYMTYLIVLIPFFVINGILTGTGPDEPVVWYNNEENMDIRILTIPLEDVFYGMLLVLMNVSLFEALQNWSVRLRTH